MIELLAAFVIGFFAGSVGYLAGRWHEGRYARGEAERIRRKL